MKKTVSFFLILIFSTFASSSEESKAMDLIVLFDTSRSLDLQYGDISEYASGQLIHDYLNYGDTIHLISFSDRINIQISRKIDTRDDLETVIGRMLLMYPIENHSDFMLMLDFISDYLNDLPVLRKKTVVVLSDGIHDPPANSKYSGISSSNIKNRIDVLIKKLADNNIKFYLKQFPILKNSNTAIKNSDNNLNLRDMSDSTDINTDTNKLSEYQNNNLDVNNIAENNMNKKNIDNKIRNNSIDEKLLKNNSLTDDKNNTKNNILNTTNLKLTKEEEYLIDNNSSIEENLLVNNELDKENDSIIFEKELENEYPSNTINKKYYNIMHINSMTVILFLLILLVIIIIFIIFKKQKVFVELKHAVLSSYKKKIKDINNKLLFKYFTKGTPDTFSSLNNVIQNKELFLQNRNKQNSNKESNINESYLQKENMFKIKHFINSILHLKKDKNNELKVIQIKLFVQDQNTNIGRRNIHEMKYGTCLSVGGGHSHFLIFLITVPYKIAEIYFTGEECILIPRKNNFFPELIDKPLFNCIGKDINIISKSGHKLTIRFEIFEDPLIKLNRMLHSIDAPGVNDF